MSEIIACVFLWVGAIFILFASIGVVRFQDVFMRMHAATKTGTVGISSIVIGLAVYFGEFAVSVASVLIVAFFLVTAPIAAHVIGRAAYFLEVPMSPLTRVDTRAERPARLDPDSRDIL